MAGVFLAATIFGGTALLCLKPVMFLVFAAGLGLGVMGMFYIWLSSELERLKL